MGEKSVQKRKYILDKARAVFADKGFKDVTMKDIVDGVMAGNVLYLTTAEIILDGKCTNDVLIKRRHHRVPDAHAGFKGRLLKLNFVEESAFKSIVHITSQVCGGNKNAIKVFHLLKDDVLDRVLHLVDGCLRSFESFVDDGVSLIEE